jgi:hypothetical protein
MLFIIALTQRDNAPYDKIVFCDAILYVNIEYNFVNFKFLMLLLILTLYMLSVCERAALPDDVVYKCFIHLCDVRLPPRNS